MSLYRFLETKFANCKNPAVGGRISGYMSTKPAMFDMAVYIDDVLSFTVDRNDLITFKNEIPVSHVNRLRTFFWHNFGNTIIDKYRQVAYERYPVRLECFNDRTTYPVVDGVQVKLVNNNPVVEGVKTRDPNRCIDQTRQKELNARLKECIELIKPYLVMIWDEINTGYHLPKEYLDDLEKLPKLDAYHAFLEDPQDNNVLVSLHDTVIYLGTFQRFMNGKIKREYMIREGIIYYEYY